MSSPARRKRRPETGSSTTTMTSVARHTPGLPLIALLMAAPAIRAADIASRWGHAAFYIPSPPTLLIQGGKTDPSSSFSYSNSPNTGETLLLPLTSNFSTNSPPFSTFNTPSAPTSSWHSITPISHMGDTWQLLSFGGDGGTSEAVQTAANSAWTIAVAPTTPSVNFTHQPTSLGSEPMRRIYHSAATGNDGKTYFSGGLKDDGSGATFSDVYIFDPTTSTFSTLPSLPVGLYHHTSMLLPNGTLLALGGAYTSPTTGSAALQPYSKIYSLDTTSTTPSWTEVSVSGTAPQGRRGAGSTLSEDGSKAFMYGGANAGLGQVFGDGWELDLGNCSWKQVASEGAGARFDHSVVAVGGDQVVVFGGYADGEPADAGVHIWNSGSNSWVSSFTPVSAASTATSSTATSTSGELSVVNGGTSQSLPKTTSTSGAQSTSKGVSGVPSSFSTSASSSTGASPTDAGAHSHPLTTPIKIGLVLGILGFLAVVFGLCLWRYLRRWRQRQQSASAIPSWPSSGPRGRVPSRPYGSREKGGQGLMENLVEEKDEQPAYAAWAGREKGASIGLGMGAIGATLASISSKLAPRRTGQAQRDPYAEVQDEMPEDQNGVGGPLRKSTRRVGNGIRLVGGPRTQRNRSRYYSPARHGSPAASASGVPVRSASIIRDTRIDMFGDEDSRSVRGNNQDDEDWMMPSDESVGHWKSAKSLLNSRQHTDDEEDSDPFEADDEDDDAPILSPFKGGPVPTPRDSRSDIGTFDEIASMSNPYSELSRNPYSDVSRNRFSMSSRPRSAEYQLPTLSPSDPLDLAGMLVPPGASQRHSITSLPSSQRSDRSCQSNALSDAEEGVIQAAQIARQQSPTVISPVEEAYVPIKRSESFFKRMAAGGITSLLGPRNSQSSTTKREMDIRDPAPQPTLWPVMSHDEIDSSEYSSSASPTRDTHPPSSWRADALGLPQYAQAKGPSLASLSSAKSMRDMVVVQREASHSSVESIPIIDRSVSSTQPPSSPNTGRRSPVEATSTKKLGNEMDEGDMLSPLVSETSSSLDRPLGGGHHRHGRTMGTDTPGSVVFNGADFASPVMLPSRLDPPMPPGSRSVSHSPSATPESKISKTTLRHISPTTPKRITSDTLTTSAIERPSAPPSGSPVPSPLVQHRRPVKDVVNSINKRGSSTPLPMNLLSPMSSYSPVPPQGRVLSTNRTGGTATTTPKNTGSGSGSGSEDPFETPRAKLSFKAKNDDPFASPSTTIRPTPSPTPRSKGASIATARNRIISPVPTRPTTMWEVIKREQGLKVANPDDRR
ncbi:hypothetical protein CI109_102967 [Kwoniella shandongensis]|uniref:Galactose oxidase n=1 Tax=Kwoniella shandongensis TaxID=1734106 RepID=A0AAJ8LIN0_9TREE